MQYNHLSNVILILFKFQDMTSFAVRVIEPDSRSNNGTLYEKKPEAEQSHNSTPHMSKLMSRD